MSRSQLIHVSRIDRHPSNIRVDVGDVSELAASIRAQGVLQPVLVEPHPQMPTRYQLLAGHRRLAAAKLARLDQIPAIVRPPMAGGTAAAIEVMLVENCQRSDLGPAEKAEAMGSLRAAGYQPARIAKVTGFSLSTVSYYLSLLELSEDSLQLVREGQVSAHQAVRAVRQVRAQDRRAAGYRPVPRRAAVAAPHFGRRHPLADAARAACREAGHKAGKLPGAVACGPCWEKAIRADSPLAAAASP